MPEITYKTAPLFADVLPTTWTTSIKFGGRMHRHTAHKAVSYHFADVADLADITPTTPSDDVFARRAWGRDGTFRGTRDMGEALQLARGGWREGGEEARRIRDGLLATLPRMPRLQRWDVAGAVPSVARAIAGNPVNMRRLGLPESTRRPVLTLICPINAPGFTDRRDLIRNAAAMCAVSDMLEEGGYRCDIIALARATHINNGFGHETAVRVKAPDQPADLAAMAFGLGHPGLFRRMVFALRSRMESKAIGEDMGASIVPEPEDRVSDSTFAMLAAFKAGEGLEAAGYFRAQLDRLRDQGCPGIPDMEP